MRISPLTLVRRTGLALAAATALSSAASAQVTASYYTSDPGSPPNPNAPLPGALCTGTLGTTSGFFINFADAGTRAAICPANPDAFNPAFAFFMARFEGTIWANAAGAYNIDVSSDDGETFTLNGVTLFDEWNHVKGGGPGLVTVNLNAGSNRFVFDMENNFPDHSFARLGTGGAQVAFGTPEPGSLVLMGSGLAGVAGFGWRRRRRGRLI